MFTGIIVEMGEVVALKAKGVGASLSVAVKDISGKTEIGDSIAINGVCLTVVSLAAKKLSFDLSEETLNSTNIGRLKSGDKVNLEPALRPDGKLGGHFVTGHIDGVGKIVAKTDKGAISKITIEAPLKIAALLVEKGSVAVDGISLTVVDVFKDSFTLVIIPHTANITTLGFKKAGDTVNLEADILGKYVAKFIGADKTNSDSNESLMKSLVNAGYI